MSSYTQCKWVMSRQNVVVYARMLIPRPEFVFAGRDFYMSD